MNFLVHNKKLFEAYNAIWDKISNPLEKGFDCERVYDNKYIRTKIELYKSFVNSRRKSCIKFLFLISSWVLLVGNQTPTRTL